MRPTARVCTVLLVLAMAALPAGGDPRVDEEGRDRAIYPPARHFDHLHMRLAIDIPSMDKPYFEAVETLTVTPIGRARSSLVLNATQMEIGSVTLGEATVPFTHDAGLLTITFPRPIEPGQKADVRISYSKDFGRSRGTGLTYSEGEPDGASETERSPQIHSQGQPEFNRTWFPCHDFPNERLTTELLVTVDSGFQVCSNGKLMGQKREADGRSTWHWLQGKPHANYLVVLVVGKFAIVGLDTRDAGLSRPIPMYLYAPIGSEKSAREAYEATPRMIAFFERWFDEPYPWDKYAQLLVRDFMAGGMENTSATTMQAGSAYSDPGTQDDIIAHEAAHQWTGDLVTYKSWEHTWLGEGWASYAEALWAEHNAGDDPARAKREYQRQIATSLATERLTNRTFAPMFPALASNRYNAPIEVFVRANNVYSKGAIVLHMLRVRLGDEVFQRASREYIERFKLREAETDDLRRVFEDVSGLSLERFFDQWVYRPGTPRLNFDLAWDGGASELTVTAEQTQQIDADNPAFALSFPIEVDLEGGRTERVPFDIDSRTARRTFKLPSKPLDVTIDPDMSTAAWTKIRKDLSMWLRQLEHPSVFAQVQAAEHLAFFDDPAAGRALARAAASGDSGDPVAGAAVRSLSLRAARLALAGVTAPRSAARSLAAILR